MRLSATSWAAQILSNRLWGMMMMSLTTAEARADDGQQHGASGSGVLEAVRQVGVEGDGVALAELVLGAVDVQRDGAALDDGDLPAAGLVHRRGALPAGGRTGRQLVAAELGALSGKRRREDLELVACGAAA